MAIYYGANRIALGANFMPPREGTMLERDPVKAFPGLSDTDMKRARRRSESIGHAPAGAFGRGNKRQR